MVAAGLTPRGFLSSFASKDSARRGSSSKTLLSLMPGLESRISVRFPQSRRFRFLLDIYVSRGSSRTNENWLPISCLGERTRAEDKEGLSDTSHGRIPTTVLESDCQPARVRPFRVGSTVRWPSSRHGVRRHVWPRIVQTHEFQIFLTGTARLLSSNPGRYDSNFAAYLSLIE